MCVSVLQVSTITSSTSLSSGDLLEVKWADWAVWVASQNNKADSAYISYFFECRNT